MKKKPFLLDAHADILYRMETEKISFYDSDSPLQLSFHKMQQAGIDLQIFALFIDPPYTPQEHFYKIAALIELFKRNVCREKLLSPVYSYSDIQQNFKAGKKSGLLSIEGGDFLTDDLRHLRIVYSLGVRAMGLTWNNGNFIADGVGELKDQGLKPFGKEVIREMNRLGMVIDVSHLAPKGVWDVLELTTSPIIASHSNAKSIYNHRRNLDDGQIKGIAQNNGVIGVTFVPYFIGKGDTTISDLMRHIDHILSLVGENHVGLGSDFDGITEAMADLRSGEDYPKLLETLEKEYGSTVTAKICGGNFLRVLQRILK